MELIKFITIRISIALIAFLLPIPILAETDVWIGKFCYRLDNEKKEAELIEAKERKYVNLSIPSSVTHEDEEYTVTVIGEKVFSADEHPGITISGSVSIPNTVKSIQPYAFYKSALKSVSLPTGLESIGEYAFYKCKINGELTLPESLTNIGDYTFYECKINGELILPKSLTNIGRYAFASESTFDGNTFKGNIVFPMGLKNIGDDAFLSSTITGELIFPNTLISIGNGTFRSCNITSKLQLPESLQTIGAGAFARNDFTGDLVIPNSVKYIGSSAFDKSGFNGTLHLPETDDLYIGEYAFSSCKFPGKMVIPGYIEKIPDFAFSYCIFSEVEIQDGVKKIDGCAFTGCKSLAGDLIIPKTVTEIERYAFQNCINIDNVIIEGNENLRIRVAVFDKCANVKTVEIKSAVSIDTRAFANCDKLTKLILPKNLETIGEFAFKNSDATVSPEKIVCYALNPPVPDPLFNVNPDHIFNNYDSQLFVPAESLELYKTTAPWSKFFEILPIGATAIGDVTEDADVKVSVADGAIVVTAPVGETVTVHNISGMCVAETKEHRIAGLTPGVYLVRVADRTFKVAF